MAQAHRRLGSKVTVIERGRCLAKDDEEHATLLLQRLADEGVTLRQKTDVTAVRQGPRSIVLSLNEDGQKSEIEGSHLLVATGRSPRVDGLGLDQAGVRVDKGGIVVDARLRTNVHGVYAIGDVVAEAPHFTDIAGYHAGIAVQNALLLPYAKTDYASLPWVTYCDPELAHVGLSEADAREQHGDDVQLLRFDLKANDRAQTERATLGSVKVWASKNGQVLGVSILAAHAGEMAHLWSMAIRSGLKLKAIASMIAPYPTFGEASKSAAGELYKPKLFSPLAQRVVRLFSCLPSKESACQSPSVCSKARWPSSRVPVPASTARLPARWPRLARMSRSTTTTTKTAHTRSSRPSSKPAARPFRWVAMSRKRPMCRGCSTPRSNASATSASWWRMLEFRRTQRSPA